MTDVKSNPDTRVTETLRALTSALHSMAAEITAASGSAENCLAHCRRNEAIGHLAEVERAVEELPALFRSILAVHRRY